jgi:hypothetical protein
MAAELAAVYHALLNEFNPWPRLDVGLAAAAS